jgi:hypothetical protein
MFGPGAYRPDASEGISAIANLPQPEIVPYSRHDIRQPCPRCGHVAYRDKQSHRTLHALGNLALWCPRDLVITYSQHYCTKWRRLPYALCVSLMARRDGLRGASGISPSPV